MQISQDDIRIAFKLHNFVQVTHSQLLEGLKCESQTDNNEKVRSRGMFPSSQHFGGVEGRARTLGWD
jgi:hypothetical protein